MKIVKKYEYKLTEKTLNEDIDTFIEEARNGDYQFDYKYGMEGLKIIKQYFKILKKEFDTENYELCRTCCKKLLLFLFEASGGEHNYFNYEDLLARTRLDFEEIVGKYISLLIKILSLDSFFEEYTIFMKGMEDYGFESINKTILEEFDETSLTKLEELLVGKLKSFKEEEYWKYDLAYLLLDIYKKLKLKEKYADACKTFGYTSEEFVEMIDDYDKED